MTDDITGRLAIRDQLDAGQPPHDGAIAEATRLRTDIAAVIADRGAGDFAPLLPKLQALLEATDVRTDQ